MCTIRDVYSIQGYIYIYSKLKLEALGEIISNKILGGITLGGLNDEIYEEIPAIYTKKYFLGLKIILSYEENNIYCLEINNLVKNSNGNSLIILSSYLYNLCKEKLECDEIHILSEEEVKKMEEEKED